MIAEQRAHKVNIFPYLFFWEDSEMTKRHLGAEKLTGNTRVMMMFEIKRPGRD